VAAHGQVAGRVQATSPDFACMAACSCVAPVSLVEGGRVRPKLEEDSAGSSFRVHQDLRGKSTNSATRFKNIDVLLLRSPSRLLS
jgi:hypothetical protein